MTRHGWRSTCAYTTLFDLAFTQLIPYFNPCKSRALENKPLLLHSQLRDLILDAVIACLREDAFCRGEVAVILNRVLYFGLKGERVAESESDMVSNQMGQISKHTFVLGPPSIEDVFPAPPASTQEFADVLSTAKFADVYIKCAGDELLPAHRVILASRSEYFKCVMRVRVNP